MNRIKNAQQSGRKKNPHRQNSSLQFNSNLQLWFPLVLKKVLNNIFLSLPIFLVFWCLKRSQQEAFNVIYSMCLFYNTFVWLVFCTTVSIICPLKYSFIPAQVSFSQFSPSFLSVIPTSYSPSYVGTWWWHKRSQWRSEPRATDLPPLWM